MEKHLKEALLHAEIGNTFFCKNTRVFTPRHPGKTKSQHVRIIYLSFMRGKFRNLKKALSN